MKLQLKITCLWLLICPICLFAQEVILLKEKVLLSDDVHLGTDVYLPKTPGAFSAVLMRTPYGKYQMTKYGEFFAKRGFAVVIQDVRGEFESEGEFEPFLHEKKDGLEVLDWIAQQAWCNGKIGGFGTSYVGFTALTLMDAQHPNLTAAFNVSGWIKTEKMNRPGGANHLMLALPWLLHEASLRTKQQPKVEIDSLFKVLPLKDAMKVAEMEDTNWSGFGKFEEFNADFNFSKVEIPVFHIAGWYDFVLEATLENYFELKQKSNATQKLLIGPWFHNQQHTTLTEVGEEDFGEISALGDDEILELAAQWFDYHLKGIQNEIIQQPEVKVFNMYANEWENYENFPPENLSEISFYLTSNSIPQNLLVPQVLEDQKIQKFIYDPYQPTPTWGGANFHFFPDQLGIKDQRGIEERKDVITYTSEVFQANQNVIGNVKVQLFASSEGADTDFTAKLVLVDTDGYTKNICDGIIRARYRNDFNQEDLLTPNKVYEFEIDLGHTAFQIQAGQRIGLEISSSNFPKYDRNMNVAITPFEAAQGKVVQQQIYSGKKYPSRLILPTMHAKK